MKNVRQQGLEGDITFTGWVKDPARYFATFDLYLLTSMPLEGVPGAVIEAAVAGVPVVGFDCFGVREIPGVQATLVPPKDVRGLTLALREKLLTMPAVNSRINGNQSLEVQDQMRQQFDMSRMVRETWDVYHHSLGN
jgi:glycosyltransferase involved in cell wall biosynthesis